MIRRRQRGPQSAATSPVVVGISVIIDTGADAKLILSQTVFVDRNKLSQGFTKLSSFKPLSFQDLDDKVCTRVKLRNTQRTDRTIIHPSSSSMALQFSVVFMKAKQILKFPRTSFRITSGFSSVMQQNNEL